MTYLSFDLRKSANSGFKNDGGLNSTIFKTRFTSLETSDTAALTLKTKKSGNYEKHRFNADKHGGRKKARDKYAYSCREQAHSYNYGNFSHGYSSFQNDLLCTALYAFLSENDTSEEKFRIV